jgi:hypothetical protein
MKVVRYLTGFVIAAVTLFSTSAAQDAKKSDDKPRAESLEEKPIPVKVQVVYAEFDGDKKIRSLPYTAMISVDHGPEWAKLRVGTRIPLFAGGQNGMQYVDVGTNIDCRAHKVSDANFDVQLSFERSWIDGDVLLPFNSAGPLPGGGPSLSEFKEPVIRQFKAELNLVLRDGQTVESTVGTDPVTGRVSKIEVTFAVVK